MDHTQDNTPESPRQILLVEPDASAAKALKRVLAKSGTRFDVVHHADAKSALAEASSGKESFHAAVLSNAIPGSSGVEFFNELRNKNTVIPTILLFGSGEEDEAAAALLAGVDDVLVRDEASGYLRLLAGILTKRSVGPAKTADQSPGNLAVVVRSDPGSTEYKAAARSLRDSQPFWRALVENPFQYFMLLDRETTIQYINRTAPGVRFEDVIGKQSILELSGPEDREAIGKHYEKVFRTGETVHYDVFIVALEQWYSVTAGPVYEGKKIIGASVFALDITERKLVENQLRESEHRFRKLAESVRDVFYILDLEEMKAVYVSPVYEEIYGRPVEEIYRNAMSWLEPVHPEDKEQVKQDFQKMVVSRAAEYRGNEYRIVKPDGTVRWLKNRSFIISEPGKDQTQVVGVVADVTAEKEAQDRLRDSEQRYRTLINHASDGIMITDLEGFHVQANEAICDMLGYTRDELLRMSFRDVVLEEDLAKDPPQIEKLKRGALVIKERRVRRKDGSIVPVEGSFKALPGGFIQAIIRDITERKKVEEELRKAHDELERRVEERSQELRNTIEAFEKAQRLAAIGTLAAGIAHEINNPVGSILMAADTALYSLDDSKQKDDAVEALASIKNDARRVGQIVKTVLQLSRQEESQKWARDPGDVARRARDITRRAAVQNNVHVELVINSELPAVVINPTEIEQVFVNVIQNAIEASRPGQTVLVSMVRDGDNVVTSVVDKGRGMSQEEIDRIFDPFFTTRQTEGGTGLGLSLSYSIVHQHNGSIKVDSQPGKRTCIVVSLPTAASAAADEL